MLLPDTETTYTFDRGAFGYLVAATGKLEVSGVPILEREGLVIEVPGLSLTKSQMERLWGLDAITCERRMISLAALRCHDRVRRLGWLCLWLTVKHGMRLWLTPPGA